MKVSDILLAPTVSAADYPGPTLGLAPILAMLAVLVVPAVALVATIVHTNRCIQRAGREAPGGGSARRLSKKSCGASSTSSSAAISRSSLRPRTVRAHRNRIVRAPSSRTNEHLPVDARSDHQRPPRESGTTARPKGVQLTHRNLWLNAVVFGLHATLTAEDVLLHTLPMFHANGWGMPYAMTGVGGCTSCSARSTVVRSSAASRRTGRPCYVLLLPLPRRWTPRMPGRARSLRRVYKADFVQRSPRGQFRP